MRVVVVANCQARPVAQYVRLLGRDVEVIDVVITHLAKPADAGRVEAVAAKADFIFAQLVHPEYPVAFLRSAVLRERYGDRVLLWPNVFFKGQTPDLCYVTSANKLRVLGPLGEYHSRPIVDAWRAGLSVAETEKRLVSEDFEITGLKEIAAGSLVELAHRERQCSIGVTDLIAECWRSQRFFFTFNHPASGLLLAVAHRLLECAGHTPVLSLTAHHLSEPLSQFVPPTWPAVVKALRLEFPTSMCCRGVAVELAEGGVRPLSTVKYYTADELIETFFRCYAAQSALLDGCRFT